MISQKLLLVALNSNLRGSRGREFAPKSRRNLPQFWLKSRHRPAQPASHAEHFFHCRDICRIDIVRCAKLLHTLRGLFGQDMAAKRRAALDFILAHFETFGCAAHRFHLWHCESFRQNKRRV